MSPEKIFIYLCLLQCLSLISYSLQYTGLSPLWLNLSLGVLFFLTQLCVCVLVTQSCPTLCDPIDCSSSGSSVQGILQARILEWVSISFSRGSSQPRNRTQISALKADSLLSEPPGKIKNFISIF